ncbi:hypothetical protein D3C87_1561050 [compost metagenome]
MPQATQGGLSRSCAEANIEPHGGTTHELDGDGDARALRFAGCRVHHEDVQDRVIHFPAFVQAVVLGAFHVGSVFKFSCTAAKARRDDLIAAASLGEAQKGVVGREANLLGGRQPLVLLRDIRDACVKARLHGGPLRRHVQVVDHPVHCALRGVWEAAFTRTTALGVVRHQRRVITAVQALREPALQG